MHRLVVMLDDGKATTTSYKILKQQVSVQLALHVMREVISSRSGWKATRTLPSDTAGVAVGDGQVATVEAEEAAPVAAVALDDHQCKTATEGGDRERRQRGKRPAGHARHRLTLPLVLPRACTQGRTEWRA